jgi:hypothetical protein
MNVAGFVGSTDEELIVRAMRDAQLLLAQHIDRGPEDAEESLTGLLAILDREDVVAATHRLCREYGLHESAMPSFTQAHRKSDHRRRKRHHPIAI